MADPREGKVLQGRYRLLSLLAEGGMGVVYRAERVGIGRPVVVKFLHAILSDKPGIVDRFEREARATARLNHPHCVGLIDFGIDEGSPYLVMEYVEGKTLADLLDHGAVKPRRAVDIIRQILAGLEHAHERGILHRDLKPANVMIIQLEGFAGDFVKILDFGLAKLAWPGEDKRDVTVEGIAIGTPGYMSPEQAAGVPSDRRSDIYCAGALLYHLVTGSKAFEGDDVRSVLRRHREETPASPREIKPAAGISKQLEDVIERAMQRDPIKRYQTAQEMVTALVATPEAKQGPPATPGSLAGPLSRSATPTPNSDATRAEAPSARARSRNGAGRSGVIWGLVGLLAGAAASVAAVAYSPLGELVRTHAHAAKTTQVATNDVRAAEATSRSESSDRDVHKDPIAAASDSDKTPTPATDPVVAAVQARADMATAPVAVADHAANGTAAKASSQGSAASDASTSGGEDDEDDARAIKADDGSNEDDRATPPEPPAAPRREASPVRSVGDARALAKKGDSDGALAGLYRLRRSRPTPSAARGSEIASLIGDLYFDRKWWTDGLREYRFAITLDPRAKKRDPLVSNSVHALGDRNTYARARRLILDYIGRSAVPALKRMVKSGAPPILRRRAQTMLATLESKSYHSRR
jgi:serine/threonine protein kinase